MHTLSLGCVARAKEQMMLSCFIFPPAFAASAGRLSGERVRVETAPGDVHFVRQESATG